MAPLAVASLGLLLICLPLADWALGHDFGDHHSRVCQARARAEQLAVDAHGGGDWSDPWGTRMAMIHRSDGGLGVVSAGPDREFRTSDDVHSWDADPHEPR